MTKFIDAIMLTFIKVKFNFNPVIDFFKELKLFTAC